MTHSTSATVSAPARAPWRSLVALYVFTATAIVGYGVFALHPERIPAVPLGLRFFGISYSFFGQLHIVLAGGVLLLALVRSRVPMRRWFVALVGVYLLSFLSEHIGTGYGFPFGGYRYTELLGVKLGGRVPALIPLSWFLMALPSLGIAATAYPESRWRRLSLAVALLVTWDLALDPAMSFLAPYWVWEEPGVYYGMPLINLFGWTATGLGIMILLEGTGADQWLSRLDPRWLLAFYGAILLLPVGLLTAAGLWGAVALTLIVAAFLLWSATARRRGIHSTPFRAPPLPTSSKGVAR